MLFVKDNPLPDSKTYPQEIQIMFVTHWHTVQHLKKIEKKEEKTFFLYSSNRSIGKLSFLSLYIFNYSYENDQQHQ